MRKFEVVLFVFVALICQQSFSQDLASRLAQFEIQKAELSEGVSVLVEKMSLIDELTRVSDIDANAPKTYENEVSSTRTLQRIVIGSNGIRKRMDGIKFSVLDEVNLSSVERESQLIHQSVGWYFKQSKSPPLTDLVQFQVKGGVVPMATESQWKHPFDVSTCQAGGLRVDHRPILTLYSFKTIESETLKDGRERFTAFTDLGGVCRITFDKDEGWIIEEVEFLDPIKGKSRDEQIAEAKALASGAPRKPITVTKEMLTGYKTSAINRTEWREVKKNQWVPWVTRITTEQRDQNVEDEIRFRDWKFKEDFDESLLDEASFTAEKISASIDFKAIRDIFDRN